MPCLVEAPDARGRCCRRRPGTTLGALGVDRLDLLGQRRGSSVIYGSPIQLSRDPAVCGSTPTRSKPGPA